MIDYKFLNNLEDMFPSRIIRYFAIDSLTIKNIPEFTDKLQASTIGFFGTIDSREVRHCIFIFNNKDSLNSFIDYLNKNNIYYTNNGYTYRKKDFIREMFEKYSYDTNIDL